MTAHQHIGSVSLRISVTERCQLRCVYCMPADGVSERPLREMLSFDEIVRFVQALKAHAELSKVHITGGEPLLRPGLVELVARLAAVGVEDLALTTNGQRLASMAMDLKQAGLKRVNISLDSLTPDRFGRLTRGGELHRTLEGLTEALRCGLSPVKLNTAVVRGVNHDELVDIARFGLQQRCQVRFLELMPLGPAAERLEEWFVSSREAMGILGEAFDFRPGPTRSGSSSRNYLAKDHSGLEGVVGFISSRTAPFCDQCRRLRLTGTGLLMGCLALGAGHNIRPLLRGSGSAECPRLLQVVHQALRTKRRGRPFTNTSSMARIGG